MSQLFVRDWAVSIGTLAVNKLRVQFHVTKSLAKEPNKLDLIVTNLSEKSRAQMTAKGMPVILEAGYVGSRSVIFAGDSRICDHKHDNADWATKIQCGDGETLYQFARINQSFSAGTDTAQVIRACATQMRVNPGNLEATLSHLAPMPLDHGFAAFGNAGQVFDRLIRSVGLTWSIQQGALQIAEPDKSVLQEIVVLNASTGLLGSPEHSPPNKEKKHTTLVCKSLLNPRIRPGVVLRLDSLEVKGDFVPQKVEHIGDSHGEQWATHVEAIASAQTLVNQ